jgi:hypothetical protein
MEVIKNRRRSMSLAMRCRRDLQKRLQVRASHVGMETFGRSPVLTDEPNIGIVARLMTSEAVSS